MSTEDTEATIDRGQFARRTGPVPLTLVVIGEGHVETHQLPQRGSIVIGRSEDCTVSVDHELISREHARLTIGDTVDLTDLDSRNGTFVHGERLQAHKAVAVQVGQAFEVGDTSCLLQRGTPALRSRKVATHAHFEARLEEECARAGKRAFVVGRVRVSDQGASAVVRRTLQKADLLAAYAPGEFEFYCRDLDSGTALVAELQNSGDDLRVGTAQFPVDGRTADTLVEAANKALSSRTEAGDAPVVADPAMQDLYRIAERVAKGSISVLLLGETGVGKEVFATALHAASPRASRPFVRLNCAALTESLLESELFGYEKGAFTGATQTKKGLLESAHGGTVMLDELGEMPLETQAKLLRVLEQREVLRVGGLDPIAIDVRFVSATNRDLEREVVAGNFRQDVYFRLNGATLTIPPLRERPAEVLILAERFVAETAAELGLTSQPKLSEAARELLLDYAWPGNIRELKNTMARAVLLCTDDVIEREHLPHEKMSLPFSEDDEEQQAPGELDSKEDAERKRIVEALRLCAGNQTKAAKKLGIGRRTLTTKLNKYGIRRPRKGESSSG